MQKKIYVAKRAFMYPDGDTKAVIKTDLDIRNEYWPWWRKKMRKKWGRKHKLITFNNCIDDWVAENWATELGLEEDETTTEKG